MTLIERMSKTSSRGAIMVAVCIGDFTLDRRRLTRCDDQGRTDLRPTTCIGNSRIGAGSSLSGN